MTSAVAEQNMQLEPVIIEWQDRDVTVHGWTSRHAACPRVGQQIDSYCDGHQHQLLFRGVKGMPDLDGLFVLGLKSRPHYSAGEPESLNKHARKMAEDPASFESLVCEICATAMGRGIAKQRPGLKDALKKRRELNQSIAFSYHAWTGDGAGEWLQSIAPGGSVHSIAGTGPIATP